MGNSNPVNIQVTLVKLNRSQDQLKFHESWKETVLRGVLRWEGDNRGKDESSECISHV